MAASDNKAPRRARVGGSGFSIFTWDPGTGPEPIAFARQVAHTSPAPVGPGATPIQPLDERHPIEIITPVATGMGQLTLEIYELYGNKVWDKLKLLSDSQDLVEIFQRVADTPNDIKMHKIVKPPKGSSINGPYTSETYHRCVITNVQDGETIEVGTMEILKQVTIGYTHVTRPDVK